MLSLILVVSKSPVFTQAGLVDAKSHNGFQYESLCPVAVVNLENMVSSKLREMWMTKAGYLDGNG